MAEKTPFFEFFESFVPPRELRLLFCNVQVSGGSLDREMRSMEVEMESGEEIPEAAQSAMNHLLRDHYGLKQLRLNFHALKADGKAKAHIYGNEIKGKVIPMVGLNAEMRNIVVEGKVVKTEVYETRRKGTWCMSFNLTDNKGSIAIRKYLDSDEAEALGGAIKEGTWLRVPGREARCPP